jgi:hypothetical protein
MTELTAAKLAKIAALDATTESLLAAGFPFAGTSFSLGKDNRDAFAGLLVPAVRRDAPPYPGIVDVDGVSYTPPTLTDLTDMVEAGREFYHSVAVPHLELVGEVANATTVEAVDAVTDDRALPGDTEGRSPATFARPAPKKVRWKLNCVSLGDKVDPAKCGSRVYRCDLFQTTTAQVSRCDDAERCCQDCRFFVQGERKLQKPPADPKVVRPVKADKPGDWVGGRLVLTAAVGGNGKKWLAITRPLMEAYAARVGAAFDVLTGGDENYPLGEKWRIGGYVRRYDRVLFLDADVVVAPDCPDLFAAVPEDRLGVRDDWPWLCTEVGTQVTRDWMEPEIRNIRAYAGRPGPFPSTCYNTGVMVLSPRHAPLFDPPAKPLPKYHCTEQHWFNLNVLDQAPPVSELPWELHWHPFIDRKWARTAGVKVWHFAGEKDRERLLRQKVSEFSG